MDINNIEVAHRIQALREDLGISMQEMADRTGRDLANYAAQERGDAVLTFTFISKCADVFGVDEVELLTGEAPHLTGYSLVRAGDGISINQGEGGIEYLHKAPHLHQKHTEPFVCTYPYSEEEQDKPIHLSYHEGQELDYIISGHLRFQYEDHVEELGPGDLLLYDSGRGHGMIATGGQDCVFLAVVMRPTGTEIN